MEIVIVLEYSNYCVNAEFLLAKLGNLGTMERPGTLIVSSGPSGTIFATLDELTLGHVGARHVERLGTEAWLIG